MPPRRRTFYLADATILANPKIRRLMRHPNWLGAIGAFHVLIGVATLNDSPAFSDADCDDLLGEENREYVTMLRTVGLMTEDGLDAATFEEWKPKPRPRYPSDLSTTESTPTTGESNGISLTPPESNGVGTPLILDPRSSKSVGVGRKQTDSAGKVGVPTSSTSSTSTTTSQQRKATSAESNPEREQIRLEALALHNRFKANEITEAQYERLRADIGKQPDDLTRLDA